MSIRGPGAIAALAVGLLAACTSPEPTPTAGAPSASGSAAPSATATPTTSPTATTSGDACGTTQLELAVAVIDAGEGQRYVPVVMRNVADADGTVLAVATREETSPPGIVVLAPDEAASALVHAAAVPSGDEPCPPDSSALRVTPPGSDDAVEVDVALPTCPGLAVRAVVAGESGM